MWGLFWPCAAFVCLYRLYTDARSKIYLCEGLIQTLVAECLHNVFYNFLKYRVMRTDSTHPGLAAWREPGVWREGKQDRSAGFRKKRQFILLLESFGSQKENDAIRRGIS
jgi:hypothetical protein